MNKTNEPPAELGAPGRKLWRWTADQFDVAGVEPLVAELCHLADRLNEVRAAIKASPKFDGRLVNAEVKLEGQFTRCWSLLGLADSTEEKRRVGRPCRHSLERTCTRPS